MLGNEQRKGITLPPFSEITTDVAEQKDAVEAGIPDDFLTKTTKHEVCIMDFFCIIDQHFHLFYRDR